MSSSAMDTVRPVLREFRAAAARSKAESQARRQRVLSYPDLAVKLTEPPLGLAHPRQWSGWIPSRYHAESACSGCARGLACTDEHHARLNESPIRAQLIGISREALAREEEADST